MSKRKKILILSGGTGGHIFPAEAFARHCQLNKHKIHWIGTSRGLEQKITQKHDIDFYAIPFEGLRGQKLKKLINIFKLPFSLLNNIRITKKIFKKVKPDIVISFGGYSTVPGGIAAKLTKTPLILHEQNAVLGRANRLLARWASFHTSAYKDVFNYKYKKTSYHIGNPLREDLIQAAKNKNNKNNNKNKQTKSNNINLLIIGGSLGAKNLNLNLPDVFSKVSNLKNINIWHQTGALSFHETKIAYENSFKNKDLKNIKLCKFIEKMDEAYLWADVIICRSGALSVSEVMHFGLPAIFIPYPHALDNHQFHNANPLVKAGAAVCIEEKDFINNPNILVDHISNWVNNPGDLFNISEKSRNFAMAKNNAVEKLYELV
jgi:UDP-N-acetylglucosamine--N-acetylmuramyl-(pentapeptide) pyrophosphoryl-undecaprenol N-acetylglucosamine transferase